jgi:hypothetical protein
MIEKLIIEKETIYMSLETGEVVENQADAMELYRAGADIQIQYRNRHNRGMWSEWKNGPVWVH